MKTGKISVYTRMTRMKRSVMLSYGEATGNQEENLFSGLF